MTSTQTLTLPPSVRDALAAPGRNGVNMIVAFTDQAGKSQFSYRGSTHLDGESRLATWLRSKQGSLQRHVAEGAEVDVIYRDPRGQAYYRITGLARIDSDPAVCDHVYQGSPPQEQAADPQRAGVAMLVDITRVAGQDRTGKVLVELSGAASPVPS